MKKTKNLHPGTKPVNAQIKPLTTEELVKIKGGNSDNRAVANAYAYGPCDEKRDK